MDVGVTGDHDATVVDDDTLLQDRNWQPTGSALTLGNHYRACDKPRRHCHRRLDSGEALLTGA